MSRKNRIGALCGFVLSLFSLYVVGAQSLVSIEKNGEKYLPVSVETLENKTQNGFLEYFLRAGKLKAQWLGKKVATVGYFHNGAGWNDYFTGTQGLNSFATHVYVDLKDILSPDQIIKIRKKCSAREKCVYGVYGFLRAPQKIDGKVYHLDNPGLILHAEHVEFYPEFNSNDYSDDVTPDSVVGVALNIVDYLNWLK